MCLEYYGLDPCHYFSSPGLSWNATLKMTEIQLELISDIDICLFSEKEWEDISLTLQNDLVKLIINTCNHMIIVNQVNILFIWTQNFYMIGQWVNIFFTVNLNCNIKKKLINLI